jgi:hypothetical protein
LDLALKALRELSKPKEYSYFVAMLALNAIDTLGSKAAPLGDYIVALPEEREWPSPRGEGYVQALAASILTNLDRSNERDRPEPID